MTEGHLIVIALAPIVAVAVSWGDLRRQVWTDRKRQDERHDENTMRLRRIDDKLGTLNGTVARHEERLQNHGQEIDRLRDEQS